MRDTGTFERGIAGLRGYLCKLSVLRKREYLEFGVASGINSALFAVLKLEYYTYHSFYVFNDVLVFIYWFLSSFSIFDGDGRIA